ncbi:MAG: SpoIVB peptidase [Clostridia bacterium]|nr:SpoIVB peptidase [Clostridia bacterium]
MKMMRSVSRAFFWLFLIFSIAVFIMIFLLNAKISDNYKVNSLEELDLNTRIPVTAVYNGYRDEAETENDTYRVNLKMFGIIPFSSTTVQVVDKMQVAVLGSPFGIKIYTEGVLVVDIKGVKTDGATVETAKSAGLKTGDYILSVDGNKIFSNEDLAELVEKSEGKQMTFAILRANKKLTVRVKPVKEAESGKYRVGIWVRDSSAGIGTLTFYSPYNNVICGLGHDISDIDTGERLNISSGEMVNAEIISVKKGKSGEPGELVGEFSYDVISKELANENDGIYGKISGDLKISSLTEVALKQEVKNGNAQILATVKGDTPKLYSCNIYILPNAYKSKSQNYIVTVTDNELLNMTGGIVQGMSGSPILQNGKLVGAVTHVFLEDSTKGYGIFAENMLDTANRISGKTELKKAS